MTFDEWCAFWGNDLEKRGKRADCLVMCRFHDSGPYAIGNIKKAYPRDNNKTARNISKNKKSLKLEKEHLANLARLQVINVEIDLYDSEYESIASSYEKQGGYSSVRDGEYTR